MRISDWSSDVCSSDLWTNYPLLPTAQWGFDIAKTYSVAWMDYQLSHDPAALAVLRTAHPHLSYLWDSEVRVDNEVKVMRGDGQIGCAEVRVRRSSNV